MADENDAPCNGCATGNATCFLAGDGWCCVACQASGGMSHEQVIPPEQPIPRVVLERMRERTDDPAALTEIERRLAKEGEA